MKDSVAILFTRIPTPGRSKTRLQPFLTGEDGCRLQKAFVHDIYRELRRLETPCDIVVCYEPEGNLAELKDLLTGSPLLVPQRGADLGERMHNALCSQLQRGYRRCVLMGSDVPLLRAADVDGAFRLLEQHDIVLCPTEDGGYCLIGMKEPCEAVFRIRYSVSTVRDETLRAATRAGKTWALGAKTLDIDDREDLIRLMEILDGADALLCGETRNVLKDIFGGGGGHEHHRPDTDYKL